MSAGGRQPETRIVVGVVGAGRRFLALLKLLRSHQLAWLQAELAAVADSNPEAVGLKTARKHGLTTFSDYRRLFDIPGLELIIELTGNQRLLDKLEREKPDGVRILDHNNSLLLHDMVSYSRRLEKQADEYSLTRSFAEALGRDLEDAFFVLDRSHRIVRANEKALKMAGITREDALGRYCFQVSHSSLTPCHEEGLVCPFLETVQTGRTTHAMHQHEHGDGTPYHCQITTHPLKNRDGEVVQVLEIFREVTADQADRAERRARAVKDDLPQVVMEDKLISLGKLVASVAHEINNPLASIYNFSKLILTSLKEGRLGEGEVADYVRYLDLTVKEASRCSKIVSNLLSFARQKGVETKAVNLVELLEGLIVLTQHKMQLTGIELTTELRSDILMVWGDPTQIQQCLTNLVFNAIEAMEDGGRLLIRGGREMDTGRIWVEITDTGHGIEPNDLPHIFEPFFSTKAQENKGVGLGLSTVKGIIDDHGGHITVDSLLGEGTTFRISLPPPPDPAYYKD